MGRYLVVANQTVLGSELRNALVGVAERDPDARFHIVLPATRDVEVDHALAASEHVRWPGEAMVVTAERMRLKTALETFRDHGLRVDGEIHLASPVQATMRAYDADDYDGVIVSTFPAGASRWLGMDLPNRLRRKVDVPVTHVEATVPLDA